MGEAKWLDHHGRDLDKIEFRQGNIILGIFREL
jgi:hypothetical protein